MHKIGILLPGSTLYPSIGMDFMQGIKSCLTFNNFNEIDYQVNMVSYGLKDDEIYAAAEKMLVLNNADVVVAFIGDYHAAKLSPLFAASGKLLIISNGGANYPEAFITPVTNTIFHSLNDCLCCFLTGKYAARQEGGHGAIMATSFFDGGYRHLHAITNGFMISGGGIKHNFVSHYKKEEFNTDTLTVFIKDNPDTRKMLAVFSGDMARLFYADMMEVQKESNLQWYVSPMMFDSTPGDFAEPKPAVPDMCGYTNWLPELENETNHAFLQYYKTENGKDANLFSMQGWESGLIIMQYLQQRKNAASTEAAIELLKSQKINSPRGTISLNEQRHTLGPAYLVQSTGNLQITVEETQEDTSAAWEEMLAQIPQDEPYSAWRNTYLCI
jgi:branched-chain amino acid transport system substrate-binding protein